jgi:hypothetical protein
VVDRRLDLGPGRSVRLLDIEGQLDQRKSPLPAPTTASNSWTVMPPDSIYVRGWITTLEWFAAAADRS